MVDGQSDQGGSEILAHFCFQNPPFPEAVDAYPFFSCPNHVKVLDGLGEAIAEGQSPIEITGDPGTGKTRLWLEASRRYGDSCDWLPLQSNDVDDMGLLRTLLAQLIGPEADEPQQVPEGSLGEAIWARLGDGRRRVIVLDRVESLQRPPRETFAGISEVLQEASLVFVFVGSERTPDAAQVLSGGTLNRLFRLEPFTLTETVEFARHCVAAAGADADHIFGKDALTALHQATGGNAAFLCALAGASLHRAVLRRAPLVNRGIVSEARQRLGLPDLVTARTRRVLQRREGESTPERAAKPATDGADGSVPSRSPQDESSVLLAVVTPPTTPVAVPAAPSTRDATGIEDSSQELTLVGKRGAFAGVRTKIRRGDVITIGRSRTCDLRPCAPTDSPTGQQAEGSKRYKVSRFHATIRYTNDGILIEDHSSNGTFVDGKRIKESLLIEEPGARRHKIAVGSKRTILSLRPSPA